MTTPQNLLDIRDLQDWWRKGGAAVTEITITGSKMQLLMDYINELEQRVPLTMDESLANTRSSIKNVARDCIERIRHCALQVGDENIGLYLAGMADGLADKYGLKPSDKGSPANYVRESVGDVRTILQIFTLKATQEDIDLFGRTVFALKRLAGIKDP